MARQKFYVVWRGKIPGVYSDWQSCQAQIHGYPHAEYKSFGTREEAERAWGAGSLDACYALSPTSHQSALMVPAWTHPIEPTRPVVDASTSATPTVGLAVDASCIDSGDTEYHGVDLATGHILFNKSIGWGTNNIGKFLAIVHGLALLSQRGDAGPMFSDSLLAIRWVEQGAAKSRHRDDPRATRVRELLTRAETWLRQHPRRVVVNHWKADLWGVIPADFGRK